MGKISFYSSFSLLILLLIGIGIGSKVIIIATVFALPFAFLMTVLCIEKINLNNREKEK